MESGLPALTAVWVCGRPHLGKAGRATGWNSGGTGGLAGPELGAGREWQRN